MRYKGFTPHPECPYRKVRDEWYITRSEDAKCPERPPAGEVGKLVGAGFTLIELLVTIAIIGILSSLAIIGVRAARDKAKEAKVLHDTKIIYDAITQLANDTNLWPDLQPVDIVCTNRPGGCPSNNEICGPDKDNNGCGTKKLSEPSSGIISTDGNYPGWGGPYRTDMPTDPWNREYFFDTDYRINSAGRPCGCGGSCVDAVVIGSYGPDGLAKPAGGASSYGCDDIIRVIKK